MLLRNPSGDISNIKDRRHELTVEFGAPARAVSPTYRLASVRIDKIAGVLYRTTFRHIVFLDSSNLNINPISI